MPTTSIYPPELLQSAAKFDPRIIDQMRRWRGYYQAGGHENNLLDRLIVEGQGGAPARLPEQVIFAGAQGDLNAQNQIAADQRLRDVLVGELIGELDPAAFERFRTSQRGKGDLSNELLQPQGPIGKATAARDQLINALGTGRRR